MIAVEHIFKAYPGHPDIMDEHRTNARLLVDRVNHLLSRFPGTLPRNPATGTLVSGEKNGGWRPLDCPIGAPNSSHKTGQAVDIYDPDGELDDWLMDHQALLTGVDLYLEHPSATRGWSHLTTRAPKSGRRVFYP